METGFLSFFVVKLKQIHIDKGITAGYRTNIPQCMLKQILSLVWQTILYSKSAWSIIMAAGPVQIDQDN